MGQSENEMIILWKGKSDFREEKGEEGVLGSVEGKERTRYSTNNEFGLKLG